MTKSKTEVPFTEEVSEPCPEGSGVTIDDFVAFSPTHSYIFTPCREMWTQTGVNSRLPRMALLDKRGRPKKHNNGEPVTISASTWLDQNRPVEQMTWVPGYPMLIRHRLVVSGGWIERADVTCFNHYRAPRIVPGDGSKAGPWFKHVRKIYPDEAAHITAWLAHRVQRPEEKVNHALVLGGAQGIGKDTLLEPVKHAVGPWNFQDIIPSQLLGRFNAFAKAVVLRVNEAHDQGDAERINRFNLYERIKLYSANPPDVLRIDEKHLREYYVFNVLGLLLTTNHKTDGIYLPADDRRHYVAWSNLTKEEFAPAYWTELWTWYYAGGFEHVAAYLAEFDLSGFDPKAPPPKTAAWFDIVAAGLPPEDAEMADAIDKLGNPDVLTVKQLTAAATGAFAEWMIDRKNRRVIPHRLERCGYAAVRNPDNKRGEWKVNDVRQIIYAKVTLSPAEAAKAAQRLAQ
jgi:Family of unknown function (DUF5906)